MSEIINSLGSWVALAIVFTAPIWAPVLRSWLDRRVSGQVQHGFDRRLEQHKHELSLAAETARFELQRQATSYARFIARRHEVYAELWSQLISAQGRTLDLTRLGDQGFEYFDDTDVVGYLERRGIPAGERSRTVEIWRRSRSEGVIALNEATRATNWHEAIGAFMEANNVLVKNELYLSDEVAGAVKTVLLELEELRVVLWRALDASGPHSGDVGPPPTPVLSHQVAKRLQEIKTMMRQELAQEVRS